MARRTSPTLFGNLAVLPVKSDVHPTAPHAIVGYGQRSGRKFNDKAAPVVLIMDAVRGEREAAVDIAHIDVAGVGIAYPQSVADYAYAVAGQRQHQHAGAVLVRLAAEVALVFARDRHRSGVAGRQ